MTNWVSERRRESGCRASGARSVRGGADGRALPASARAGLVCAAIGLALALPGCAAGSLQGLSAQTPITTGSAEVQTTLRAEAKRLVQPLPAGRPRPAGGFSIGGMLDVLVNGMSEADMAAQREAADTSDGAEAMAERYLAARGGSASPDLDAIEADLEEKAQNAASFAAASRAVLTWHGQLRASFYNGALSDVDGAKLSALIERDKAVISQTYETVSEQAAVLAEAVERVRGRMDPVQARRVSSLAHALKTAVSQLGVLSGQGLRASGAMG